MDWCIAQEARLQKKPLSVAWIDFKKAFDVIPHRWIRKCLRLVKAPELVLRGLDKVMTKWASSLEVRSRDGEVSRRLVKFRRGVFQGDTLSPLLFGLAVAPLSAMLGSGGGFSSAFQPRPITHTMFMDDLKVYEESPEELEATISKVEGLARAVGMTLGVRKCAVAHLRSGRVRWGMPGIETIEGLVETVRQGEPYRYLGILQTFGSHAKEVRARVSGEYLRRVKAVWSSPLGMSEKVRAHNGWAVAVLRYYFAAVEWTCADRTRLDCRTRGILESVGAHNRGASVPRLYYPREKGGRGLLSVSQTWELEVVGAALYLVSDEDWQIEGAVKYLKEYEETEMRATLLASAVYVLNKYQLPCYLLIPDDDDEQARVGRTPRQVARKTLAEVRVAQRDTLQQELKRKSLHGIYQRQLAHPATDRPRSCKWLVQGKVPCEVEARIVAAQDGVTLTRDREVWK